MSKIQPIRPGQVVTQGPGGPLRSQGGAVVEGVPPSAASEGRHIPLIRIDFDSGPIYISFAGVETPSAFYKDLLLEMGTIRREVSPFGGEYSIADTEIRATNAYKTFSKLKATQAFRNRKAALLFGDADLAMISAFSPVASLNIRDWEIVDRTAVFELVDHGMDRFQSKVTTTMKTLTSETFPDLPANAEAVLVPVVYGEVSSFEFRHEGALPAYLIDAAQGQSNYRYVVAQHRCRGVPRVYWYGSLIEAPEYTVTEVTYGGVVMTCLDFAFDPRDPNRTTEFEITVDVEGITDDGTPSGNLIRNPAKQLRHFLVNWAQTTEAEISAALFDQAQLDAGILESGAAITNRDHEYFDIISRWCGSFNMTFFTSTEGQFSLWLFNFETIANAALLATHYTEEQTIFADSFRVLSTGKIGEPASTLQYNYAYNFAYDFFERQPDTEDNGEAARLGEELKANQNLWFVRQTATALAVSAATRHSMRENQQYVAFDLPISEFRTELNNFVRVSHSQGIASDGNGYVQAMCRILRLEITAAGDSLRITAVAKKYFDVGASDLWKRYIKLGNESVIASNWSTASASDKFYGYLGDETETTGSPQGTLGTSDPIKLLS